VEETTGPASKKNFPQEKNHAIQKNLGRTQQEQLRPIERQSGEGDIAIKQRKTRPRGAQLVLERDINEIGPSKTAYAQRAYAAQKSKDRAFKGRL